VIYLTLRFYASVNNLLHSSLWLYRLRLRKQSLK
jgi:hypothetical protein